jgi:hypothetical protein
LPKVGSSRSQWAAKFTSVPSETFSLFASSHVSWHICNGLSFGVLCLKRLGGIPAGGELPGDQVTAGAASFKVRNDLPCSTG